MQLKARLAFETNEASRETARQYLEEAGSLAKKIADKKGRMMIYYGWGMVYEYETKYDSAIGFYNKVTALTKDLLGKNGKEMPMSTSG